MARNFWDFLKLSIRSAVWKADVEVEIERQLLRKKELTLASPRILVIPWNLYQACHDKSGMR